MQVGNSKYPYLYRTNDDLLLINVMLYVNHKMSNSH